MRCRHSVFSYYKIKVTNTIPYHVTRSSKGYRFLIYSGDHDKQVPFQSTIAWIKSLNYSVVDEWRPWFVDDQVSGYTRSYSNWMTFAIVKESKPPFKLVSFTLFSENSAK
ncbi:putative serine carboxypeptidase-like 52 [Capsicum annuum]|uniref:putative serine carboxypeptidase-like 52 n=1 Tax=Capsicum annuum TaxID=4072 RepID=UPI001FB0ED34|nr:putative serine carboxypeptidase-like 52 [Capsicum annuum]